MWEVALLIPISLLTLWILYWYYVVSYFEKFLKTVPGPPRVPILGNALSIRPSINLLSALLEFSKQFKGNFKLYIGGQPRIFIVNPKDMEYLLSSTTVITKSDTYKLFRRWLGDGLLTSSGKKWRSHRKIITPAFHFQILREFVDVFNSQGDILVKKLDSIPNKISVDIDSYVTRCTLDIICETAMGTSVNAQDDIDSEYAKCVKVLLGIIIKRSLSPILYNDFIYPFTSTYRKENVALGVVHSYTKSVINCRRREFYNKDYENVNKASNSSGRKRKRAFLDLLLEYSMEDPTFTENDIKEEVESFMFGGYDTTAISITFTLYCLATNPDQQEMAYEEMKRIFSNDPERRATYQDLQDMKYLEMIIKETLRIYTTAPYFSRKIEKHTDMNGQVLPKGTMVNIFPYGIHHDPNVYKHPETFDPDRFSPENSKDRSSYAFIPFSAGPRNCLGQKFAMLEMKSVISNILRNFELCAAIPECKVVIKSEILLKSDNGVFIQLKKRNL